MISHLPHCSHFACTRADNVFLALCLHFQHSDYVVHPRALVRAHRVAMERKGIIGLLNGVIFVTIKTNNAVWQLNHIFTKHPIRHALSHPTSGLCQLCFGDKQHMSFPNPQWQDSNLCGTLWSTLLIGDNVSLPSEPFIWFMNSGDVYVATGRTLQMFPRDFTVNREWKNLAFP